MTLKLVLQEKTPVGGRIAQFTFAAADGAALPAYTAGAHLDFNLGEAGTRSYSLVDFTPPGEAPASYTIAVQREEEGEGGSIAMHALETGAEVTATEPKNDFELREGGAPVLLIAGGIGVTPIISFAAELDRRGTEFAAHYCTRSEAFSTFGAQLSDAYGGRVSLWFDDSKPADLKALIEGAAAGTQIYCCGPKGMIEAVREIAAAAGIDHDHVHFELFASPASHEGDQPFEVEIADTGEVYQIPADKTIVEVLEEAGVDVMYDCQRGDCGICQCDVVSGEPDHRDVVLSDAERAEGKIMQICVSRAKSARLVLDI